MRRIRALAWLGALSTLAGACDDDVADPGERFVVLGTVADAQLNTRLVFFDEELNQLDPFSTPVRQDGGYGPLAFPEGTFFGAGRASGFTTGEFEPFQVPTGDTTTVDFDLNPITVPLAVGNRWIYDEIVFATPADTGAVTVEIVSQQAGQDVAAVFQVEERRAGSPDTLRYFLAQDAQGIRKSADPAIDATDELLLRLPAALGAAWSTVDFTTGAALQKRLSGFSCDDDGCQENNDDTIAVEPAGVFLGVAEIHTLQGETFVTVFSDVGVVDSFRQGASGALVSQLRLRDFQLSDGREP